MDYSLTNNKVSVLIPAHNEGKIIIKTLESVYSQSLKAAEVIIICDNCTDDTIAQIQEFKKHTKENVIIFETINNAGRKAGALNQVFNVMKLKDYVLIMDADTLIDKDALKLAVNMLKEDKNIGAVCSRAGVLPYEGKSLWEKIIWTIQHIEYGQFDSHRIETKGSIKVAHGMATLFRVSALRSIPKYREKALGIHSGIYLEDNLVEDYEITLCLKHNWQVMACMDMLAWTDVPLSLRELWIQRLRWLRGGVDTLRYHGWNKVTRLEILNHGLFVFLLVLRVLAIGDKIVVSDSENSFDYVVYDIEVVSPDDTMCFDKIQGDYNLSMVTCTKGSSKRLIVYSERTGQGDSIGTGLLSLF